MTDVSSRFTTESPGGFPNVVPRDAATLILLDRSQGEPRILMGKRHSGLAFMPDKFVFPGGAVDPADRQMKAARRLAPVVEQKVMARMAKPSRAKAQALAMAAIRETFEETGLLIGARRGTPEPAKEAAKVEGPWGDFLALGIEPDLSGLQYVARAVTPPGKSRRYDTRFFAADVSAVAHRIDGTVGPDAELTELVWIPLAEAKSLDLLAVTEIVLDDLVARLAAGFSADLPVPYYRMLRGKRMLEMV